MIWKTKNVLFELNDIGKTNFLYALRFLFDRDWKKFESDKKHLQELAYNNHLKEIQLLEMNSIYLSKIDLENDLYEVISNKLDQFVQRKNTLKNAVEYLQEQKMIHVIELCQELDSVATIKKVLSSLLYKFSRI